MPQTQDHGKGVKCFGIPTMLIKKLFYRVKTPMNLYHTKLMKTIHLSLVWKELKVSYQAGSLLIHKR